MATRSHIAIENQDGTVTSIYCHWDGYVEGNGKTLQNHYTDRSKVEGLIALGDISSLGSDLDETVAYHRDEGGYLFQTQHTDVENFYNEAFEVGDKYAYLFTKDNKWLVSKGGTVSNLFVALEGGISL